MHDWLGVRLGAARFCLAALMLVCYHVGEERQLPHTCPPAFADDAGPQCPVLLMGPPENRTIYRHWYGPTWAHQWRLDIQRDPNGTCSLHYVPGPPRVQHRD